MSVVDKQRKCRDCGADFTWTAGEQEFFSLKGLINEPQRCPSCRLVKRQRRYGPREMHSVQCAECGSPAQVPFLPRDERPVYCSGCYDKVRVR